MKHFIVGLGESGGSTEVQSKQIAEKLSVWLAGRKLRLNLSEKR